MESLGMSLAQLKHKRVLVTGHTGFKGSWLSIWLATLGAKVHGFALTPEADRPSIFHEAQVESLLASHTVADIQNLEAIQACLEKTQPEIVFHLAAQPLVRKSYREPISTWSVNVMGTINLLEAIRHVGGVRVCQVITSDKCYENSGQVCSFRETDPMGGYDPYSSSKGATEIAVSAWRRSYFATERLTEHGCSLSSVRAGNVIGGGDWAEDRIIPDCIRSLSSNEPIQIRNPNAIRPWQHVLEPLSGYLALAGRQWDQPESFADSFNFGPFPSGNLTVGEVASQVVKHWGKGTWVDQSSQSSVRSPVHEAAFLKLDITKASSLLGWTPKLSAHEAIKETVHWYRERFTEATNFDALKLCRSQIESYECRSKLL
jgi:CDP-glucose 4,6-dehydratase